MENFEKTICITGCEKGVGYGILKTLCEKEQKWRFVMLCKNEERCSQGCDNLCKECGGDISKRILTSKLDLFDSSSINNCIKYIKEECGMIDCLVNNAAWYEKSGNFNSEVVERTFRVNVYGTMELTEGMLPYLNHKGKIVFISDQAGLLSNLKSEKLRSELMSEDLSMEKFKELIESFKKSVNEGKTSQEGWPENAYMVSKIFINVYCKLLSKRPEITSKEIQVYSCSPGDVSTELTGFEGKKSIEEGAGCPVWLIEQPWKLQTEYQGKFFYDCKPKNLDAKPEGHLHHMAHTGK